MHVHGDRPPEAHPDRAWLGTEVRLIVRLTASPTRTNLDWEQEFESEDMARRIERVAVPRQRAESRSPFGRGIASTVRRRSEVINRVVRRARRWRYSPLGARQNHSRECSGTYARIAPLEVRVAPGQGSGPSKSGAVCRSPSGNRALRCGASAVAPDVVLPAAPATGQAGAAESEHRSPFARSTGSPPAAKLGPKRLFRIDA